LNAALLITFLAYHNITLSLLKNRDSCLDNRKLCNGWGGKKKRTI